MSSQRTEITIRISPDGSQVQKSVKGIKGQDCVGATKFLEEGLGLVTNTEYTPEYHQAKEKKVVNVGYEQN